MNQPIQEAGITTVDVASTASVYTAVFSNKDTTTGSGSRLVSLKSTFSPTVTPLSARDTTLAGYWDMETTTSDGKLADLSGNGNAGTAGGGVIFGTITSNGPIGKATNFNGTHYIGFGNASSVNLTTQSTLTAWVRPAAFLSNPDHSTIITKSTAYYCQLDGTGRVQFAATNGGGEGYLPSVSTIPLNQWTHIVCIYNGTTKAIYINGVLDASISLTGGISVVLQHL